MRESTPPFQHVSSTSISPAKAKKHQNDLCWRHQQRPQIARPTTPTRRAALQPATTKQLAITESCEFQKLNLLLFLLSEE